jgi:hypothetical protein
MLHMKKKVNDRRITNVAIVNVGMEEILFIGVLLHGLLYILNLCLVRRHIYAL